MKTSFKIPLLCLIVMISVVGITFTAKKIAHDNYIKAFMQINDSMSKNFSQVSNTPGIRLRGLASDPAKKVFKIGFTIDRAKITPEQLKEVVESYLENSSAFTPEQDWKSLFKPYNIKIEDFTSEKLFGEKPIDSTEIKWNSF